MSATCEAVARAALGPPVKKAGSELLWRCPNHEDHDPSLSVNPRKDCWGCFPCAIHGTPWQLAAFLAKLRADDKPAVTAWLREHGLLNGSREVRTGPKGRIVATYDYTDESGKVIFQVVRYEPKDFKQRRPDGNGGWTWKLTGTRRVLYNLPEALKAKSILFVEGEKDCESAKGIGLVATTSGATGSWRAEFAEVLRGKRVAIIADADEPGRKHAREIARSLPGIAEIVKLIELPGAKDLSEWMEKGGTRQALLGLIQTAPEWGPCALEIGALLDKIVALIRRYVVMTVAQARAVALWVIHTHCFQAADTTPYLSITSPEKRSGKTLLLEVLETLVFEPWLTGRTTAAVLPRRIEAKQPTLLLDESDAAFASEKEYAETLRGVLNSGYRRSGIYSCCVGQGANLTYKDFPTFCPKVIAGIGKLPDTVADRSIPIRLKRAIKGERGERFRKRDVRLLAEPLRQELEQWAAAYTARLLEANPTLPEELSDRQQDVSEPLLAIADVAGGEWPDKARLALTELCTGEAAEDDSIGVKLLADIRTVFFPQDDDGKPLPIVERIASEDLAKSLGAMEDRPWAEWGKSQKPISQPQLARQLSRFAIGPKTIRLTETRRLKGYERKQFEDAWERYARPSTPIPNRDTVTSHENNGDSYDFQSVTATPCHASENAVSVNKDAGCHGVTVSTPPTGAEEADSWPDQGGLEGEL